MHTCTRTHTYTYTNTESGQLIMCALKHQFIQSPCQDYTFGYDLKCILIKYWGGPLSHCKSLMIHSSSEACDILMSVYMYVRVCVSSCNTKWLNHGHHPMTTTTHKNLKQSYECVCVWAYSVCVWVCMFPICVNLCKNICVLINWFCKHVSNLLVSHSCLFKLYFSNDTSFAYYSHNYQNLMIWG